MAKFAQVGYGGDGRGVGQTAGGYTYIVNDNVRAGDTIVPIPAYNTWAKHDIKTTAVVLATNKSLDVDRPMFIAEREEGGRVKRDSQGHAVSVSEVSTEDVRNEIATLDAKTEGSNTVRDISNDGNVIRNYGDQTTFNRKVAEGQALSKQYNQEQRETYESYSNQFLGDNKQ